MERANPYASPAPTPEDIRLAIENDAVLQERFNRVAEGIYMLVAAAAAAYAHFLYK